LTKNNGENPGFLKQAYRSYISCNSIEFSNTADSEWISKEGSSIELRNNGTMKICGKMKDIYAAGKLMGVSDMTAQTAAAFSQLHGCICLDVAEGKKALDALNEIRSNK
jgi:hypothetical protein